MLTQQSQHVNQQKKCFTLRILAHITFDYIFTSKSTVLINSSNVSSFLKTRNRIYNIVANNTTRCPLSIININKIFILYPQTI